MTLWNWLRRQTGEVEAAEDQTPVVGGNHPARRDDPTGARALALTPQEEATRAALDAQRRRAWDAELSRVATAELQLLGEHRCNETCVDPDTPVVLGRRDPRTGEPLEKVTEGDEWAG